MDGSIHLHGKVGLEGDLPQVERVNPSFDGKVKVTAPTAMFNFDFLKKTYNLTNIDLKGFLDIDKSF